MLVIDRINGVAYVALSERADRGLAERWVAQLGYNDLVTFTSSDAGGGTVYHTNVMMAIGTGGPAAGRVGWWGGRVSSGRQGGVKNEPRWRASSTGCVVGRHGLCGQVGSGARAWGRAAVDVV